MSLLKTPPGGPVRSLEELFAIAQRLEREAGDRYADLASRARAEGMPELAELFERLAEEEREHERSVVSWSRKERGKSPDPAGVQWPLPKTFDDEAGGELAVSRTAGAYRILSMAVRNEERTFTLWSYIAAEAPNGKIRAAAEAMARQELRHVALLRRARRQAYHAERKQQLPEAARSIADRLAEAAELERHMGARLDEIAGRLDAANRNRALEFSRQSIAAAGQLEHGAPRGDTSTATLDTLAVAERLVDDYLSIAESSRDETMALQAQERARFAIKRLAWLREMEPH
jgi:rubrerythrin